MVLGVLSGFGGIFEVSLIWDFWFSFFWVFEEF